MIAITGLGMVTPLGVNVAQTWDNLCAGKSGAQKLTQEWAADLSCQIACPVAVDPHTGEDPTARIEPVQARKMDRTAQLGLLAAREAWEDASLALDADEARVTVCVGTGIGGLNSLLNNRQAQTIRGSRRVSPMTVPMLMANSAAAYIGQEFHANWGVRCPVSACASGAEAISLAADQILLGRADVALAGGTESVINPLAIAGFANLGALSSRNKEPTKASRPWDKDRDGFVMAEGAGILVLESVAHAQARGAKIYGYLAGSAITNDAYHIVHLEPSGKYQIQAMQMALAQANLAGSDICYVNAHATSTPAGDLIESRSTLEVLQGSQVPNMDVGLLDLSCTQRTRSQRGSATSAIFTANKSALGHLLGASGAVEAAITVLSLQRRLVTPTINLEHMQAELNIDVAQTVRTLPSGQVAGLSNSFGFGGANVSLAFISA